MSAFLPFVPENPLEEQILAASEGRTTGEEMLRWLVNSTVLVASVNPLAEGDASNFMPLLMGEPEKPLVAIFTAPSRQAEYGDVAQHMLVILGGDYFLRMPHRYGVIVNPGFETQMVIQAFELEGIRAKIQYKQL